MKLDLTSRRLAFLNRRLAEVSDPAIRAELERERNALFFETPEGQAKVAADVGRIAQALGIGQPQL
jgi:hypothetical protein